MGVRTGQYFIIGTILIAGLLIGILSISNSISTSFTSDDITRSLFENTLDEFPKAVSASVQEEATSSNIEKDIRGYTDFQQYMALQYGIDLQMHFLIGLPTDDSYNITIGNYRGETMEDVWLRIDDTAVKIGTLGTQNVSTYSFPTQDRTMEIEINSTDLDTTFTTSRKVLSYLNTEAGTGDTVWRETRID